MKKLTPLLALLLLAVPSYAASIPGVVVAAEITTGDDTLPWSIGNTLYMQGTAKMVPDIATRDAISMLRRFEGMTCYVTGETNMYILIGGTNNAAWTLWASGTNVFSATIVAAGTNIVVTVSGNTYTVSLSDPVIVQEADAGTLVVTNPPYLNLINSTNYNEVLTNDLAYVHLRGTRTNLNAPWAISNDGELFLGTNALAAGLSAGYHAFAAVSLTGSGDPSIKFFDLLAADSASRLKYGDISGFASQSPAASAWSLISSDSTGSTNTVSVQSQTGQNVFAEKVDGTNRAWMTYDGNWTFNGETNTALTANTVMKAGGDKNEASIPAAEGALTNRGSGPPQFGAVANNQLQNSSVTVNGTANHITTTSASIALGGSATLDVGSSVALVDANNVWTSASSNFVNNAVWNSATNANNTTPDFAVQNSLLSTNNAFTWLLPTHLDASGKVEQWIKTSVTNTTAVAKLMTAPANVHVCGAGSMYVTNWTEILWQYFPPSGPTNMWPIPGY